ncbi:MAG TPA: sulfate adenylyltransferase subunit CysN [Solirubrobacteraceae bacterium]|jgi:bifunctional enzyme CysN/CysC|nr:sulfate adenylyltransferase subunit CysN [Solirubrobacteraceae bacterium]
MSSGEENLPRGAVMNGNAHSNGALTTAGARDSSSEVFRRLSERPADLLRFATAGSVDDGKSTLIGRLLYDSKQVLADQLAHVEQTSRQMGHEFVDLSLLTDGLRAEREQGITIDVAYRYFATAQRRFIIADTPGHEQYTRNMVTGASTADLAIVLVDARKGVLAQSKRHAFISSLLGIPHVVVCVNKMDLVSFDETVFDEIVEEFDAFAARLELPDVTFIPISALLGDNVVERSQAMPWYQGPPLLYHLEHVHIASDRNLIDVRFPVQWVIRPPASSVNDYRAYAGQLAGGIVRAGDEVVVLPGGQHTTVAGIDTYEGEIEEAFAPMSVALRLADDIDVSRGSMIVRAQNQPTVANRFECQLCWMSEQPLSPSRRYLVKHTTRTAMVGKIDVRYRIDVETLRRDSSIQTLELNDLARVHMELSAPLVFDSYRRNRVTGSLIVIDEATNDTVAAGVILDTEVEEAAGPDAAEKTERSPNVRWQGARVTRTQRWQAIGHGGATLWFTGLPGAGKSTVAAAVEERMLAAGQPAFLLDGDNLRHGLNGDLGFDEQARRENVRRTAHVARLLAESGTIALVSLVSPYAADREAAATLHAADELGFLEVFVDAPLELCEQRDPKGLYARARAGELSGMTGVGAPYEAPAAPDLVLGSFRETVEEEVERVIALLLERGLISPERFR